MGQRARLTSRLTKHSNKKRDRLRAEAEKLREQADELRKKHKKCLEELA